MTRLIELMRQEFYTFDAVMKYRSRSFYLFIAAFLIGPAIGLLLASMLSTATAVPGLGEAIQLFPGLFALFLTLKLTLLATQAYLKDRTKLLRL